MVLTQIKEAALELGYQADETFCLKISQLREIFVVRWSVFLLGPAGCGKSAIWKTLMRAQQNFGEKTFFKPINPKVRALCFAAYAEQLSFNEPSSLDHRLYEPQGLLSPANLESAQ